jgi:hypothetical protein
MGYLGTQVSPSRLWCIAADLGLPDAETPTIVYNDNRGCVDWTKGASVSNKLRHLNMRELGVRLYQNLGAVSIQHIEGKHNVADLFTKEIKDSAHFLSMAFTLTTPRQLRDWIAPSGGSSADSGVRGVSDEIRTSTTSKDPALINSVDNSKYHAGSPKHNDSNVCASKPAMISLTNGYTHVAVE